MHWVESLECRRMFANGIEPSGEPTIFGFTSEEITNALVAQFSIIDASGSPGSKWNAQIQWGDGGIDKLIPSTELLSGDFGFLGTHTYNDPGNYTIVVMIAVPGSHIPNANTVTTSAVIETPEPSTLLVAMIGAPMLLSLRKSDRIVGKAGVFGARRIRIRSNV